MTGDERGATGVAFRRWLGGRGALWVGFIVAHGLVVWLNLEAPGLPMGDVTGVYRIWAENAAHGWLRMGIDAPWVYPILAFAPMSAALAFGEAYVAQTWLAIVVLLDAIAFSILIGRAALSRRRRLAAWWWLAFIALLGPIALGRIDAVTVPFAITGLLWAAGRPRVAATLLTIGAWVKVWPAALVAALVIAVRRRLEVVTVAVVLSIGILGVSLLAGSGMNAVGFIAEQAGRGLQIEAPAAVFWLWRIVAGAKDVTIVYDRDILTFQIAGPGAGTAAALTTPLMIVGVLVVVAFGIRAARRGAYLGLLLAPLSLAFVVVLMLANKVGSPQFVTWLAAPVVLGLVLRPSRFVVPAVLAAAIALFTQIIYPYWYGWLLIANPAFVFLLTAKVVLLVAVLVWALRAVWQAGSRRDGAPTIA
ncbi:glycosyltransferase 87 family protein [Agromyces sp. H3Y2-19a]|uniref:glycosyltransferase 87 family protein n=1 Tax=Agromyces chromiiresistens TaxID=3030835 RepID=UPI0023B88E98|nr:glycosyltransferase 87 family protein [Agromyces chromiiresistens]MDF0514715.1 glycosyltransferase 87 family protein [Agromyces chromiiresistens]